MKKALRLMLTMVLFICNVNLFANNDDDNSAQVSIGNGSDTDMSTPFVMKYSYSWSETIYQGNQIGGACIIESISYHNSVTSASGYITLDELDIYMAVTDKSYFSTQADWIPASKLILVYSGKNVLLGDTPWEKITLDKPFYYNGKGNLAIVVAKKTNQYKSANKWYYTKNELNTNLYYANDISESIADNPPTSSDQGVRTTWSANIILDVVYGEVESPLVITPNPIDFGYRPSEAWTRPMKVEFSTEERTTNILSVKSTSPSFIVSKHNVPAEVTVENPYSVSVKLVDSNIIGDLTGTLEVSNSYGSDEIEMKATTYVPVSPDVWEKAAEITEYPYSNTPDFDNLYDNYCLPGEEQDGPDAVYKLTLEEETSLAVSVKGANAKLALYDSEFNGKGGPDSDNYYGTTIDPDQPEFPEIEKPILQGNAFSYDFNNGSLVDWRTIDSDGDAINWGITSDGTLNIGEEICLYSLSNNPATNSKLNPDNYIVTRGSYTIDKNSVLEFDVRALDELNYRDETYAVVVSTDGINFTTIGKEKCPDAEWHHKTISLAEYAGQNVVIGFRHFEAGTKSFALLVDNAVLRPGRGAGYDKIEKYTLPAGTYYLAVSATERFSVNVNAMTKDGYNPVTEVFAEEKDDDNVNLCWSWDFILKTSAFSDGKSLLARTAYVETDAKVLGYNIYRKNILTDEIVNIAENVTDTLYVDNTWNTATMGIYQWGVSVIYDDENGGTFETAATYSNTIGKDMFTTLNVTVTTENGASPEGAKVTFLNVNEPSFKYEVVLDDTGEYHWDSFRRGTYKYTISLDGYNSCATNSIVEIWDAETIECELDEIFVLGDIFVSSTGWAMWKEILDDAESYTIMLDGEIVDNPWLNYYQYDVTNLVEGQEYVTTVIGDDASEKLEYTWTYAPCDNLVQATDFEVVSEGKEAHASWTLPVKDYAKDLSQFKFDFENGTLNGWISIDNDGDGNYWSNSKNYYSTPCGYQSWYGAMSHSAMGSTSLTPDNYLVTTKKYLITETSKLTFDVSAENNTYAEEHYGIAVSTKSNHILADFEMIWEETLETDENASSSHGTWYTRTIDLSKYAGQEIHIAFRHFNCTGQFWINIDNVELSVEETRKADGEWMHYDNGESYNALGLEGGSSFYWGIMFPADELKHLAGGLLTKVSMYDYSEHDGNFMIYLGGEDAPGMLVHSQPYKSKGSKTYMEYELTNTVDVTGEQNIWIVFNNNAGYQYVASYCSGETNPNGRWYSNNGKDWFDFVTTGYNITWQIRAFVDYNPTPNSTDLEVLGVMLFRDGKLLTQTPVTYENFVEILPEYEEYEYSLRVVYGGEEETYYSMSCPQNITLNHTKMCKAPKDLYGTSVLNSDGTFGASLQWPYTLHGSDWLYYDNGIHETGLGLGGGSIYWGIMFPAEELGFYEGTVITKVAFFDREKHDGNILIYYGGDNAPETMIHSQPYEATGKNKFVEYDLTMPIPIDTRTNLWIVFNNNNGGWVASCCKNTGNPNGRWMSVDGESWADIASAPDMNYTWMIRAYVTSEMKGGAQVALGKNDSEDVFSHYNLYRGTSRDNLELIAQPKEGKYFDEIETGTYYYQVTSTYFEGDLECESAPANSYNEPENDYIVVEVTSIKENGVNAMMIYPNPTHTNLNVTADDLRRITIINTLGQMVYDRNVDSDTQIINMSNYDAGVYIICITTETGVAVERVTVIK